jgi:hypothetical protein
MRHFCLIIAQVALLVCLPLIIDANAAETADPGAVPGGLNSDRPSFAESPGTVPPGQFQLEGGVKYIEIDSDNRQLTVGQLNFRIGWQEALEFRLFWDGYVNPDPGDSDFADPNIQVKWRFTPDRTLGFRAALLGSLSVPLGDSDAVEPRGDFIWSYGRPSGPQPFGTVRVRYPEENGERRFVVGPSLGAAFPRGKLEFFAAYFGIFKEESDPLHSIDGGITYLLNAHLQLDLQFGFGLNDHADTFAVSTGFTQRW